MNRLIARWEEYAKSRVLPDLDTRAAFFAGAQAFGDLYGAYGDEPDLWRELREVSFHERSDRTVE